MVVRSLLDSRLSHNMRIEEEKKNFKKDDFKKHRMRYGTIKAKVSSTRPAAEQEFLMLIHPDPKRPKMRHDFEGLATKKPLDLHAMSKKLKAK